MKINYFNADHTHALFDLPTSKSIEQVVQLFKGDSSHWINENKLLPGRFARGRGYGAFSVSHSDMARVAAYIARQEEHHKRKTFAEEYELFVKRYGLEWRDERAVQYSLEISQVHLTPFSKAPNPKSAHYQRGYHHQRLE